MKSLSAVLRAKPRSSQLVALILTAGLCIPMSAIAAKAAPAAAPNRGVEPVYAESAEIGPAMNLMLGKSTLLRLPGAIDRISVGNPNVADVTLISARELYLLGKTVGSTNVILWRKGGATTIIDVSVNVDAGRLESRIHELLPEEKGIRVTSAAESIILTGEVSNSMRAEEAVSIADAYVRNLNRGLVLPVLAGGGQMVAPGTPIAVGDSRGSGGAVRAAGSQVVNMMRVRSPQQVMLEVKVAEVSKTLLDKLGAEFRFSATRGDWTYSIINSMLTDSAGLLTAIKSPNKLLALDAEKRDGLLKILAEPNIVAISGQEGSFLAGGKIFIPVARSNATTGGTTITLEEKEFGVGLKFTPTVLDGGRINLKVAPEVSELSQTGSPFTTIDGTTAILPSFTVRRAQTTVQLIDGQSFAIAGLIKNNVTESVKRFPGLGEIPILGALFRSSEFQTDRSELMFVITPRLVKPLASNYALPTDGFVPPSRGEFFLEGRMEGRPSFDETPAGNPTSAPADGGFQTR
ncbi:type II and III secretion system protein family protein [Aromatoleum toluclasticum]|nr:type II and III secretion system protein family protein [Aromatoleum toluclasticum]